MNSKLLMIGGGLVGVVILVGVLVNQNQNKSSQPTQETPTVTTPPNQETASSPSSQETMVVTVTKDGFSPQNVTVKSGGKVTWTNNSGAVIQINSAVHPTHQLYPPLNLGAVAPLGSVSLVFDNVGTYKYHNHLDPSRTGTVVVE